MSGKPAARVTDPIDCPTAGHGSNAIVSGSPNVFINGLPAARQGDLTACGSTIVSGVSSTVFINGLPAATQGSLGSHGGVVIGGSGSVIIGDVFTPAPSGSVTPPPSAKAAYSGRFQLIDQKTGKPVAGCTVKVWSSGGWSASDTTDSEGKTSWVYHDTPEKIYIDLVQDGKARATNPACLKAALAPTAKAIPSAF
nr:PAAR domain-containing protein [uncultured Pseudomonas sp.]